MALDLSPAKARGSLFVWMIWFLGEFLALEAGAFVLGSSFYHLPVDRLLGPYVVLGAVPAVIGPFIYRIKHRTGVTPRHRARDWAVMSVVFLDVSIAALLYCAVAVGFASLGALLPAAIFAWVVSVPVGYVVAFRLALEKFEQTREK